MRPPFLSLSAVALALALSACGTQRAGMAAADLGDPEILHVYMTSNTGEIVTSDPFMDDFASAEVRQLAQMIVRDHSAANERAEALPVEPRNNPMSTAKNQMAQETAQRLQGMEGAALDRAYLDAQIRLHQQTLQELDQMLIPNADDAALRTELQTGRQGVVMHLERAQALRAGM